jgi:hypothetical protein
MPHESAAFGGSDLIGIGEADFVDWHVEVKHIVSCFGGSSLVLMYYSRRTGNPHRKRFNVLYSLIKRPLSFSVPDSLIEDVTKSIEDKILSRNIKGQYSIKKAWHIVEVLLADGLCTVLVNGE